MIKIYADNGTAEPLTIILSTRDNRHLGEITNTSGLRFKDYLNHPKELYFAVSKLSDGIEERLWDEISGLRLVYVKEVNTYFEISVSYSENDQCVKNVTGRSLCECELSQKILYNLEVNTETDISRADYEPTQFYNPAKPNASLLHRVLSGAPAYSLKHVDPSLMTMQRTFSEDNKSIYDFLTNDCASEFNCIFLFDSVERSISVYDLCTVCDDCGHRGSYTDICPECGSRNLRYFGDDTTILVSADNLTDEIKLETDTDNVKNCFKLQAGDDIMTAAVMSYIPSGGDKIFFISSDQMKDMPSDLSEKIRSYNALYDSMIDNYHGLMDRIYECIERVTYYTSKQMPEVTIAPATAGAEAAKLTASNLSPLSLSSLTSYTSSATVNSALINYAKVYVRSGFVKLEIDSGTFSYAGSSNGINTGTWTGRFKVTNYSDKEDVAYSSNLKITINDDYQSFINEKILKTLSENNTDESSVSNVLNIENIIIFKNELKRYCLNRLISFRDAANSVLSVLLESNGGSQSSELYDSFYLKYYEKMEACKEEISRRKKEIEGWEEKRESYENRKDEIQKTLDFKNFIGEELYNIFTTYIRESKFTNSNYISDGLSDDAVFERAQEFIEIAEKELINSSYYQHSIRADMYNLLLLDEFSPIIENFKLGNWIRVQADDNIYRLRLVSYEINYDNLNTINTEFSDVTKTADGMNDIYDILKQADSISSAYGYVSRQASNGHDADVTIEKMRAEGLDSALFTIKNSDTEEITFGRNGLMARSYDDISDSYSPKQLAITHNVFAYTVDGWRSVKCALGEMKLTIDGKTTWEYGLNSDFCISSKIIAGNIYSANYSSSNKKGTRINLDDGSFTFADGKIVYDGKRLVLKNVEIDWSCTNEPETMWTSIRANAEGVEAHAQQIDGHAKRITELSLNVEKISSKFQNYTTTEKLASVIEQDAKGWSAEVIQEKLGAYATEEKLAAIFKQTAKEISAKVSQEDFNGNSIISEINLTSEEAAIKASKIKLEGAVTANNYFRILEDGSVDIIGGTIAGFHISDDKLESYYPTGTGGESHAGIGSYGHTYAFFAGVPKPGIPFDFYVGHNGYMFSVSDMDFFGYIAGNEVAARRYGNGGKDNTYGFRAGINASHGELYGWSDYYYDNYIVGSILGEDGGFRIRSNNGNITLQSDSEVNIHAGQNHNYINLFNDTQYFGSLSAASSIRYKKNIAAVSEKDADMLLQLQSVEFDYKETGKHSAGFIAEDAYKLLPQIVGLRNGKPDNIDYIKLIPYMVKKMQMQEQAINDLVHGSGRAS